MANLPSFTATPLTGALVGDRADADSRVPDRLDRAIELDREIRRLTALKARALHAHVAESRSSAEQAGRTHGELQERAVRAEIAAALTITERAADHLVDCSERLVETLPSTLSALESGAISYRHALILLDETLVLNEVDRANLEAAVLPTASETTPSGFRRKVRVARERRHPESIQSRHDVARSERGVSLEDVGDGMSILTATLPSPAAHAIFRRITDAAKGMATPHDDRTMDQRRADLLTTVLLTSEGGAPFGVVPGETDSHDFVTWFRGIRPELSVSVPALTLLGLSDEPATMNGAIPIDPTLARILVGNAKSFTRVLTHPETGAILSVGRRRYKVPKDLRRHLVIRDLTCRFPGCSQPAARCDLDHTIEWQHDGQTIHLNLAHLCRGHHLVKGETDWRVEQDPGGTGVLTWTSPSGRVYRTYPGAQLAG